MKEIILLRENPGIYENGKLILGKSKRRLWPLFLTFFDKLNQNKMVSNVLPTQKLLRDFYGGSDRKERDSLRRNISNLNKLLKPEIVIENIGGGYRGYRLKIIDKDKVKIDLFDFYNCCGKLGKFPSKETLNYIDSVLNLLQDLSVMKKLVRQQNIFIENFRNLLERLKSIYMSDHSLVEEERSLLMMRKVEEIFNQIVRIFNKSNLQILQRTFDELCQQLPSELCGRRNLHILKSERNYRIAGVQNLKTHCYIYEVNIDEGWGRKDCKFELEGRYSKEPFNGSFNLTEELKEKIKNEDLREIIREHIEKIWDDLNRRQRGFLTDKQSYGLYSYQFRENAYKLRFVFKLTSYRHFVGTNKSLDIPLPRKIDGKYDTLRKYIEAKYNEEGCPLSQTFLQETFLSNRLGTATAVVTKDNRLIITKGGGSKVVMPNRYMVSIAEGMVHNWRRGKTYEHDKHNPFKTIYRGAKQELLLEEDELNENEVKILAFGSYCEYMQPFIWAYAETDCSASEIINRRNQRLKQKGWDVDTVLAVPFDPKNLAGYLAEIEKWSPPQALAVYLALCYKYDKKYVDRYIINEVKNRGIDIPQFT